MILWPFRLLHSKQLETTNTTMQAEPTKKKPSTAFGKLQTALEEQLAEARSNSLELSAIRDGAVSVVQVREILEQQGVVVIKNASSPEGATAARASLAQAYHTDVVPQLKPEDQPSFNKDILGVVKEKKHWPSGIIGNKSFGFLFAQPEDKTKAQCVNISGDLNVVVAPCSAHKANLELMTHPTNELALSVLLTVTGNKNGMMSQDSVKMHREDLTKPHVDIYGSDETRIHRVQAMFIGPGEGGVRLCFVRFSQLQEVQKLICEKVENPKFYQRTGFLAIPAEKRDSILKCFIKAGALYVGSPGDLLIWKSGVIHTELKRTPRGLVWKNKDSSGSTERYVVGTHRPHNLSRQQLLEIGLVADSGFIFNPYNSHNKGNAAGDNSVHRKTTQYKRHRTINQAEKDRLRKAVRLLQDPEAVQDWGDQQNPRLLHCLGVSQPAETLFTDPVALRIFTEN